MNVTEERHKLTELVEERLRELKLPSQPCSLYEPVKYTLSFGGKRIRPFFTLSGCGMCGGDSYEALSAAVAIELLHNFTLLHDDIMDSASTRRGNPSVFKKWDTPTAILSGDAMYAWAFEQLQYYGESKLYSKEQYHDILDIFLESAKTVCEGQAYDIDFEKKRSVSTDEYILMIEGKTAALITGSFKMGGIVAGSPQNWINRLEAIGNHVGIGFQIQDDLLDVVADPAKFGKKLGGDILSGKKTFLSILSLHRGTTEQQQILHQIFEKPDATQKDLEKVIELYRQLGVIETAKKTIEEHYNQAIEHIELFENSSSKADLKAFLLNLKNREY